MWQDKKKIKKIVFVKSFLFWKIISPFIKLKWAIRNPNKFIFKYHKEIDKIVKLTRFWEIYKLNDKAKFSLLHPSMCFKKHSRNLQMLTGLIINSYKKDGFKITIKRLINYFHYQKWLSGKKNIIDVETEQFFIDKLNVLNKLSPYRPKVTVIVTNYNHEKFLRQRLESIYSQTYENYEVILLDDNSSDKSKDILMEYAEKHKEKTRYIFNQENSGSVFSQWKKGLAEAKGELIWIAESDDYCTNNFISSLINFFSDESVKLAYCRSIFKKNNKAIWDIESYLADIDKSKWRSDFVDSAHRIVNSAMVYKNIIPNASSAIFRNPKKIDLLSEKKWESLRFCGDWIFYLHIIRGGLIAYTTKSTNYFRQHENNTSTNLRNKDIYYIEHEYVARTVAKLYKVSTEILEKQRKSLLSYWRLWHRKNEDIIFESYYDIKKIKVDQQNRKFNIAVFGYAFAAGGGETFPITLANALHKNGYGVTFVDCDKDVCIPGIKKMLKSTIPIIKLSDPKELSVLMNSFGIEIMHSCHSCVDLLINKEIKLINNCKHIVTLHGMYESMEKAYTMAVLPRLWERVDKWIYTTDKNLEIFKKLGFIDSSRFLKIGNALFRSSISPVSRKKFGINDNAFIFCLVSRGFPEKGWEETIRCIKNARDKSGRDIQLIIIGDGIEKERLQKESNSFIHFLGFKSRIRDYYAMSNMGILPSRFRGESFPLVVIDCLFAGKPILASEIGEIKKMLITKNNNYAGILFKLNDWKIPEEKLTELIIKCVKDQNLYKKMINEVEIASKKFEINNMYTKYAACYSQVLKDN